MAQVLLLPHTNILCRQEITCSRTSNDLYGTRLHRQTQRSDTSMSLESSTVCVDWGNSASLKWFNLSVNVRT